MSKDHQFVSFKNIRVTEDGFQVVFTRAKQEITMFFAGHSKRSLRKAEKCRESLLKTLPDKRKNSIPKKIYTALGLSAPVAGVFRRPAKRHYSATYLDRDKRRFSKSFKWDDDEIAAYARAVEYRIKMIEQQ